jgi:hypothetical protein
MQEQLFGTCPKSLVFDEDQKAIKSTLQMTCEVTTSTHTDDRGAHGQGQFS